MPVTPFLTTPDTPRSEIKYINEECRNNALKIRRENDWFSHADTAAKPAPASQASPRYSNEQHRFSRPSSARWWTEDVVKIPRHATPESRKIQEKLEAVNQEEWYKHGPGVAEPLPPSKNKPKTRRSACQDAKTRMASGDSNSWFKHDQQSPGSPPSVTPTTSHSGSPAKVASCRRNKEFASYMPWLLKETPGSSPAPPSPPRRAPCPFEIDDGSPVESPQRGNTRIISPVADSYDRRNKQGTASQWYAPKPSESPPESSVTHLPRKGMTGYANRSTTESEDWYSFRGIYDGAPGANGGGRYRSDLSPEHCPPSKSSSMVVTPESNFQMDFHAKSPNGMEAERARRSADNSGASDVQMHSQAYSQSGNGYKNFVRIDDYIEPAWSVLVDSPGIVGQKF